MASLLRPGSPAVPVGRRFHHMTVAVRMLVRTARQAKVAEIRVSVPKHEFFVKQTTKSFEESFDNALDSVTAQLKKVKEKEAA